MLGPQKLQVEYLKIYVCGDFKKEYIAAIVGKLTIGDSKILENYLVKDELNNLSRVTSEGTKGAKNAKLEYTVIGHTNYKGVDCSYMRVKLYTGRHHQIRVQLANIGHPLYGDIKYGGPKGELALYAYKIKFIHPTKDEIMEFESMPEKKNIWRDI